MNHQTKQEQIFKEQLRDLVNQFVEETKDERHFKDHEAMWTVAPTFPDFINWLQK